MKRTSSMLIVGIVAAILVGAYSGYLFFEKGRVTNELSSVEREVSEFNAKKLKFENNEVLEAINAKRALSQFEGETSKWSEVIKRIQVTVPTNKKEPIINILSYSGANGNAVSMSMKSIEGNREPYFDVADAIEAFNDSKYFDDVFVSSISSSETDEGGEILSFSMVLKYVEEVTFEDADALDTAIGDVLEESLGGGVAR